MGEQEGDGTRSRTRAAMWQRLQRLMDIRQSAELWPELGEQGQRLVLMAEWATVTNLQAYGVGLENIKDQIQDWKRAVVHV